MHLKVFGVITLFPQQVTINGWKRFFHPGLVNPSQKKNLFNLAFDVHGFYVLSSIMAYFINYGAAKCLYKDRHCKNQTREDIESLSKWKSIKVSMVFIYIQKIWKEETVTR